MQRNTDSKLNSKRKERLSIILSRICALQRQYGMKAAELETLVEGFSWAIEHSGHNFEEWIRALGEWVLRENDIPRPADIMKILEPPAPVYSSAMYIQIKKNMRSMNTFVSDEEKAYCRAYEKQEMEKMRGGSREFHEAQRQLEMHSSAIDVD